MKTYQLVNLQETTSGILRRINEASEIWCISWWPSKMNWSRLLQSLRMQLITSQCVARRKVIIHSRVPSSEFMVVEHRAPRFFSVGQAIDQCIRVMGRKLAIRIPLHAENTFFRSADHWISPICSVTVCAHNCFAMEQTLRSLDCDCCDGLSFPSGFDRECSSSQRDSRSCMKS